MDHDPAVTTMTVTVAVTLVGGVLCQAAARAIRLPSIVPLLVLGILLGPEVLGIVQPASLGPGLRVLVGLAVAVILFEGGLSLKREAFRFSGRAIRNLVLIGALVTWGLAGLAAALLFPDLGALPATLFGALVIVTGPTVIIPLLQSTRPRKRVADVLRGEAILIDPIGALYAVLALELILVSDQTGSLGVFGAFALRLGLGALIGAAGALLLDFLLRRDSLLSPELKNLLVLAGAIGLYALAEGILPESGLLAVTLAGFLLGWRSPPGIEEVEEFKGLITVLMVSTVFILLAANLSVEAMLRSGPPGLILVAALILVVRPANVFLSTLGTDLSLREKLFLSWIAPRGIVAAAVSSLFALILKEKGIPGGEMVMVLTFAVIVGTVVIQGPTARLVCRLLGVQQLERTGFLVMGANRVGIALGRALQQLKLTMLVVDTNGWRVHSAREAGLPARRVNPLDELAMDEVDLDGIGNLVALTTNDTANRLAVKLYAREFGRDHVRAIKLADSPEPREDASTVPYLFGDRLTLEEMDARLRAGATIDSAEVDEATDSSEIQRMIEGAEPLMAFDKEGRVRFIAEHGPLELGETLLYLAPPAPPEGDVNPSSELPGPS